MQKKQKMLPKSLHKFRNKATIRHKSLVAIFLPKTAVGMPFQELLFEQEGLNYAHSHTPIYKNHTFRVSQKQPSKQPKTNTIFAYSTIQKSIPRQSFPKLRTENR